MVFCLFCVLRALLWCLVWVFGRRNTQYTVVAGVVRISGWIGSTSELVRKAFNVALRFRRVCFPDVARGFVVDVECGAVEAALAQ